MNNLTELFDEHVTIGNSERFPEPLAQFIVGNKLEVVVETGAGISSLWITKKMGDAGFGRLYSIDPDAWCGFELIHPQYKLIKKKSVDALLDLYIETKGWDMFLHDSNHDILCQTYEFEFAYACLKPGGWIASDDWTWGGHNAWQDFVDRHALKPIVMGSIMLAQKPIIEPTLGVELSEYGQAFNREKAKDFHDICLANAKLREQNWLLAGNANTPCFEDESR